MKQTLLSRTTSETLYRVFVNGNKITVPGHTLMVHNLFLLHAYCRQVAQACSIRSVVIMILSIPSSLGYAPHSYQQYPQNPSQFPAGPTHQPVYSQPGYPPPVNQYPPQQGYYYQGQPAPSTQLPPVGSSHHTEAPPHQYTGAPMQGPSYQGV